MNLLITGSIAYDEIMNFPGEFVNFLHPEKLHQINVSFALSRLEKQLGGTGTNIAYNAAITLEILRQAQDDRWGTKIKLLGSVGRDGKEFVTFLNKNEVGTDEIIVDRKLYTAKGKVITDKKDNQIWGFYYGASQQAKNIGLKKYVGKNDLLVISANHPGAFIHFQNEAIKYKIPYLYDPGMAMTWIKDKDLYRGVMSSKYLVGNDYEMAMILKRIKKTIRELIPTGLKVITTLGEKGVRYEAKDQKIEVKSYKVKKVVDPTGAGDAWRGGFIAGLTKKLPVRDCLRLGNVMASFAIEKYGTVNHRPAKKEIERRLKKL